MVVYKYKLKQKDLQSILMPEGAKIISAQIQFGNIVLWAYCNPLNYVENRVIEILTTGNEVPNEYFREFLGTVQFIGGDLIYHIFERKIS